MNSRGAQFAQAARGPILLITVGLLFALHQAGVLRFGRSWPLLIIVLGVMKLIERMLGGVQPYVVGAASPVYPPPYTAGGPPRSFSQPGPPPAGGAGR